MRKLVNNLSKNNVQSVKRLDYSKLAQECAESHHDDGRENSMDCDDNRDKLNENEQFLSTIHSTIQQQAQSDMLKINSTLKNNKWYVIFI